MIAADRSTGLWTREALQNPPVTWVFDFFLTPTESTAQEPISTHPQVDAPLPNAQNFDLV